MPNFERTTSLHFPILQSLTLLCIFFLKMKRKKRTNERFFGCKKWKNANMNKNLLGSSPPLRIKKSELLAKRSHQKVPFSRHNGAPGHADNACYQRRCSGTADGEGRRRAAGRLVGTGISMGDDTKGLHPSRLPQTAAAASSTRRRQGHQNSAVSSSAVSSGHSTSFSRNSSEDQASPETTVDRPERKKPSSDDPDDGRSDSSALDVEAELSDASSGSLNGSNEKPTTLASRSSYSSVAGE
jgi:hypothetical protein